MVLPSKFLFWFGCFSWLGFPISLGSQASRGEAQIAASAELESEAEPWSLPQPTGRRDGSGLLSPLFKVLCDEPGGAQRLQPDSGALRYMKRLYKAYATKEGIPKSNRSHLYNTVRLFTPSVQHKQASVDQATGAMPSVGLLFNLDRVTAVERLLKSALLYTFNDSVPFPSAMQCTCHLLLEEPESSGQTLPRAPYSFPFASQSEFRKKHKWVEVDVTALLQPLVASAKRSIQVSVNFTCAEDRLWSPSARDSPVSLVPPSLLLYLNDTSTHAYQGWYSLHNKRSPPQAPGQRGPSACPMGREAARGVRARHRRGEETVSSELQKPLASFNLSEYFKQFLFPQNECELHDFRLSFSQLKWDSWIVAPHRYNPRYCKGDCPRAVGHRYGSPVHTMVQNIIYEKQLDDSVPRPSCVPAKYSPLSVLTVEPDGSIAYKEYEDMIATKCTCR
ncbi:growth differentiation factor 9 [Phyllostomus discolor]|uniref:Growth/differentiation factor 9 n=1 Tax=Phyllostomus discolor TaxID=89673 RepID=A0A6J2MXJ4_9CHIR|nr:growth/differentiation factor 9 [Phyllostomus discolor]KAF6081231.1 growth differentiation factor 9 [Phyllostomus discolor]